MWAISNDKRTTTIVTDSKCFIVILRKLTDYIYLHFYSTEESIYLNSSQHTDRKKIIFVWKCEKENA